MLEIRCLLQPGLGRRLFGKILGRYVLKRTTRLMLIVIDPPRFNILSGIVQRDEYLRVHALVSDAPVKTLNHCILEGFPRPNEIEHHPVLVGPSIERPGRQFAPIVHGDHLWGRPSVSLRALGLPPPSSR